MDSRSVSSKQRGSLARTHKPQTKFNISLRGGTKHANRTAGAKTIESFTAGSRTINLGETILVDDSPGGRDSDDNKSVRSKKSAKSHMSRTLRHKKSFTGSIISTTKRERKSNIRKAAEPLPTATKLDIPVR